MAQVEGLLDHIQFAQAIRPTVFILDMNQLAVTPPVDILYVSEPIVNQAMGFFSHRRLDPAAPIMAAHDDVEAGRGGRGERGTVGRGGRCSDISVDKKWSRW